MILRTTFVAALAAATAAGQFQYERQVAPGAAGPNRLDVDAALLAGAAPDLRDFRLFDDAGREVPYLIVEPARTAPEWHGSAIVPVQPTKTASGFEADLGSVRTVDRLRIDDLDVPFMKHVRLEGSGDRTRWNLLADATVFDLPDQKLKQHEIAFAPGLYRYLRVTWDDRTSARVRGKASAAARIHKTDSPPEPLRAELNYRATWEPKATRYRIQLPAANLPITAIDVQVAARDVFRNAVVSEPSLDNGEIVQVEIGSSTLRRAVRDGVAAADLTIPIQRPSGRELLLTVDSGSKPPLPVVSISAVYSPQPWIYFEASSAGSISARYGDRAAKPAQYDLEAARPFIDRSRPAPARWYTSPVGTSATGTYSTVPMPERGPAVARGDFRFSRPLPAVAKGLVVVPLDAHVLAHTHDAAADVRVVDSQSRQIPYVVERRPEPLVADLKIPRSTRDKEKSTYRLSMPYETLQGDVMLVLTTNAGVFERHVSVVAGSDERRGREPSEIASATWRNSDAEVAAPSLSLGPVPYGTTNLDVVVDEGDNAPLPLTSARLLLPNYALRLNAPGEPLSLIYGNRKAEAPRYDLAILAPQLFTLPARELRPGSVNGRADQSDDVQKRYFWLVIGAAVVILGGLLARLLSGLRTEEARSLGGAPGGGDPSRGPARKDAGGHHVRQDE